MLKKRKEIDNMAAKRPIALAILEILKENTDEEHLLYANNIIDLMKKKYGLEIERRTLYKNLDMLKEFGYEILTDPQTKKGYYLAEREFDKAEILLLCNAIHASHFISSKQSDEMIKKLLDTQSKHLSKEFSDKVYMPNQLKTPNKQLLFTISTVSEAIRDGKKLKFIYLKYDYSKKLIPRKEEPYIVEPRFIVYNDSRAYMIVTDGKHSGFGHYRLDRIKNVEIIEEPAAELLNKQDAYEYARNKLFMYAGKMIPVTFRCKESILDQMIDIFGTSIMIIPEDNSSFILHVNTTDQGAVILAQQFIDSITILEPESLKERFKEIINEAKERYGN